jgi:glyoxylase-like metal-dependent hydrolase (beta-lactamase superfamily II)
MNSLRKLTFGAATLGALVSFGTLARAQQEPYQHVPLPNQLPKGVSVEDAKSLQALIDDYNLQEPLVVTKIRDNIYLARGGTGRNVPNVGFVVGETGVILVDNKNSLEAERAVLAEIAKITTEPVNTNIVLHSEHESGIAALPTGLTIIAQENARKEMEVSTARDKVPSNYFPTNTIGKDKTMTIDGVRVRLLHWAPAYTSGDMIAYFPDQKVAFGSDLVVTDFPLGSTVVDTSEHGSVAGWIENVKGMLALDVDTYVSGHGGLFTKNDLRTKLAFVQDKWDKVKAMIAQGKSLDEIKAALAGSVERNPNTTEIIYTELTTK